jgi:hypothetical protein
MEINIQEAFGYALAGAKSRLSELLKQRDEIDAEISRLALLVEQLSANVDLPQGPIPSELDLGLSDAIRLTFRTSPPTLGLTPTEVRDKLRDQGFNLDKYASELPPIHNTITRLEKAGEIEPVERADGVKAHRWVSLLSRVLREGEFVGRARTVDSASRIKPRQGRTGRDYNFKNRRAE